MTQSLVGKTIDRYRVVKAIREGGVGAVYLAEDTSLARPVALKFLKTSQAEDADLVRRLHLEAKTMARLENPNIVSVYDFVSSEEHVYVAMQFVDGESLAQRLERKGKLPLKEVLRVIRDCARGLAAAHEQQILHRDMKPSNVILTRRGEIKVADFGLAQPVDDSTAERTTKVEGTPHYMSPEQCTGVPQDAKSDIYSLGVMFYQLLVGEHPFRGATIREILTRHVREAAPDPRQVASDVEIPDDVVALIHDMMNKDPVDRPDAAEVVRRVTELSRPSANKKAVGARRPKHSLLARLLPVFALILVCAMAVLGIQWFEQHQTERDQRAAWDRIQSLGAQNLLTKKDQLEIFIRDYPDSPNVEIARREFDRLRERIEEERNAPVVDTPAPVETGVSAAELDPLRGRAAEMQTALLADNADRLAKSQYELAIEIFDEATQLQAKGEFSAAFDRYQEALRAFDTTRESVTRERQELTEARQELRAYEQLRSEAMRLGIPELDAPNWDAAEDKYGRAKQHLTDLQPKAARQLLELADADLRHSLEVNGGVARERLSVVRLLEEVGVLRIRALAAGAQTHASSALEEGDAHRDQGQASLDSDDFSAAQSSFEAAQRSYEEAIRVSNIARAMAEDEGPPITGPDSSNPPPPDGTPGEVDNATKTVAQLLARHFAADTEFVDGVLTLKYSRPEQLQRDARIVQGGDATRFDNPRGQGGVVDGERTGLFVIDCVFAEEVELEVNVNFHMVLNDSPFFKLLLFFEGEDFYGSDFGTNIEVFKGGKRRKETRSRIREHRSSPTKWVQRGKRFTMSAAYKGEAGEKGELRVKHRFSDCAAKKVDDWHRGKVGVWWNDTVFSIHEIVVRGRPDQEWLEATLGAPASD